jgi:hypothetical protein
LREGAAVDFPVEQALPAEQSVGLLPAVRVGRKVELVDSAAEAEGHQGAAVVDPVAVEDHQEGAAGADER